MIAWQRRPPMRKRQRDAIGATVAAALKALGKDGDRVEVRIGGWRVSVVREVDKADEHQQWEQDNPWGRIECPPDEIECPINMDCNGKRTRRKPPICEGCRGVWVPEEGDDAKAE